MSQDSPQRRFPHTRLVLRKGLTLASNARSRLGGLAIVLQ